MAWNVPPRLRTVEDPEDDRRATWLELFFDLVFVVAVAQLSAGLGSDVTAREFLVFAGLFVPVWWAWVGFTFYADRFDTDDVIHRLFMLGGMFAVGALASTVPDAYDGDTTGFAVAYAVLRLITVGLNMRAWWHLPAARVLLNVYIPAFSAAIALFLLSLAFESPTRYLIWAAALLLDLGAPLVSVKRIQAVPIHASHMPERVGLLTIIVFGETVLAVVVGTESVSWTVGSGLVAALGFTIAAALWWIYFDYLDPSLVRRTVRAGQIYLYVHLPLLIGLTGVGVGVKLAIKATAGDSLSEGAAWALGGGVALMMASLAVIHFVRTRSGGDLDVWLRVATAAVGIAVAALGTHLGPYAVTGILAVVLVAHVALEVARHGLHQGLADPPAN
jgi:low temperature requirement protein LtrA